MTQTPSFTPLSPGESTSLNFGASQNVSSFLTWYQKKPGQAPRLLIYAVSRRTTGVAGQVSGSGSGTDFTLAISVLQPEDAAVYHC